MQYIGNRELEFLPKTAPAFNNLYNFSFFTQNLLIIRVISMHN